MTIRVLIVDDDDLQRDLVARALSTGPFDVVGASRTTEIAEATKGFVPDLVLVDVNIPGTSSAAAVEAARAVVPAGTRIVLFSADDEAVLRMLARRVNADGWLSKGTPVLDLGARLQAILNR